MFYLVKEGLEQIPPEQVDGSRLTAGYVDVETLGKLYEQFGFAPSTVESCRSVNAYFRSGVEVYEDYIFTELRIAGAEQPDDCVALYLQKNGMLLVDIDDKDGSTRGKFETALRRCAAGQATTEKLLCCFIEALVADAPRYIETTRNEIARLEERILDERSDRSLNRTLLGLKRELLQMHNYYDQLLDISETVEEDEYDLFTEKGLMAVSNLSEKLRRLREDIDALGSGVDHLQDAYTSALDLELNNTMKFFTVLSMVFFPLTIIVGWYGMNFEHMPEFAWKYGYVYVIVLSILVVAALTVYAKRKKWL